MSPAARRAWYASADADEYRRRLAAMREEVSEDLRVAASQVGVPSEDVRDERSHGRHQRAAAAALPQYRRGRRVAGSPARRLGAAERDENEALQRLLAMGFHDVEQVRAALRRSGGDVWEAVSALLDEGESPVPVRIR